MEVIRVGILTVSDRCSKGAVDVSGAQVKAIIEKITFSRKLKVVQTDCVPDSILEIAEILKKWSDELCLELVITVGGTGIAPRDVTPEATESVIHRKIRGMSIALIQENLKHTPMAMLSRPVCGIRNNTLIINFPGSTQACIDSLKIISPVITHALELIRDDENVLKVHEKMKNARSAGRNFEKLKNPSENEEFPKELKCPCTSTDEIPEIKTSSCKSALMKNPLKSKVSAEFVAERCRISPYPMVKVEKAQDLILDTISPLSAVNLPIEDALGYATYSDIRSTESHPPFDASLKDGYAVITSDGAGTRIVAASTLAGELPAPELKPGYCVRITTGAPIAPGADAVVQVEDTVLISETDNGKSEEVEVEILKPPELGQDIRKVGSDIEKDSVLVKAGTLLTSSELGLLTSVGISRITVYRKPKISVLSTGNELETGDKELSPGKIRDSNKITLMSLLREHGYSANDGGIAKDDPDDLLNKIQNSLNIADVLITTGGVSMGERDILPDILMEDLKATLHFGRVNMKPGKPTKFFTVPAMHRPKFVFALPGNPVSATVTCHLFVFPALRALSGFTNPYPSLIKVKIGSEIKLDERNEFARASLKWSDELIVPRAVLTGNQISSRMMSMLSADCLLHLPAATDKIKKLPPGKIINAQLIRNFINS